MDAKFAEAELVPSVLPEAPKNKLVVNYEGTVVEAGDKLSPRMLRFAPRITYEADPEAIYSLVMIDPDNLSRKNPSVAEWLHWLVVNVPASNLFDGMLGGQVLMAYGSPAPQPRTGDHRYVLVLYEHAGRRVSQPIPNQRAKFKVKQFQEKHNLGAPVAGLYFIAHNDNEP
uniref:Phosphatidylethanolamine-binding protein n=1 Tax=Trichuris muris TaxID=70415 RepID=A0A5S6QYM3_TRIMR